MAGLTERQAAQQEVAGIAYAGDAAIDRLTAELGAVASAAIMANSIARPDGTRRITQSGRRRIMKAVDAEIARIYGKRRGDTSAPMYLAIARASRQGNDAGARRVVNDVRRRLKHEPELLAMLEAPETAE